MYIDRSSHESTYTIKEVALMLSKSPDEVEYMIKSERLGFDITHAGITISNNHVANYFLGSPIKKKPEYKSEGPKRKRRKWYPKARTKR